MIDLLPLNATGRVDFNFAPDLSMYKCSDIKRIENINVSGYIIDNGTEEYEINLDIKGKIVCFSSINGSDVIKDIDINYNDFVLNLVEKYKTGTNSLDISPIIWENILLEVPISISNPEDDYISLNGTGWEITR